MSSAPAMPLFLDAYLADTTHLSTEEHGAYLLLLMAMWRRGGAAPNDDRDLARIVGLALPGWRKTKKRLMPLLTVDGDLLTQSRLQKEWQYVKEKHDRNSANGAKGGRPRSNINNRLVKADGSVSLKPNESTHNPEPITHIDSSLRSESSPPAGGSLAGGSVRVRKRTPRDELLAVLDAERADAVLDHRQRIRKPLTARAALLLARKLARCADPNAAADAMIANGWQGFEPEWLENRRAGPAGQAPPREPTLADLLTERRRNREQSHERDHHPGPTIEASVERGDRGPSAPPLFGTAAQGRR